MLETPPVSKITKRWSIFSRTQGSTHILSSRKTRVSSELWKDWNLFRIQSLKTSLKWDSWSKKFRENWKMVNLVKLSLPKEFQGVRLMALSRREGILIPSSLSRITMVISHHLNLLRQRLLTCKSAKRELKLICLRFPTPHIFCWTLPHLNHWSE